ncbi:hypothetical protein D3C75_702000 [compost metagenome]
MRKGGDAVVAVGSADATRATEDRAERQKPDVAVHHGLGLSGGARGKDEQSHIRVGRRRLCFGGVASDERDRPREQTLDRHGADFRCLGFTRFAVFHRVQREPGLDQCLESLQLCCRQACIYYRGPCIDALAGEEGDDGGDIVFGYDKYPVTR